MNDLGKAGELAKAYTDSKWFPDSELAGKHMGYAVTFDGLELDRGNVKALGKILETEAKFGESIHDAAGRYAAAGYTMKGLEYAGDGAGLLLGAGAIGMAGKQLLKMGLKEGGKQLLKTKLRDEVIERGKNLVLDEVADIAGMTPEQRMAMQLAVSVGQSKLSGKLGAAGGGGKTYQTYTKTNPKTGEVYVGRTSGTGTPMENIARRDASHHMNDQGFGKARIDRTSTNSTAIRGREQQMINANGGAKSTGGTSGNAINGISSSNPRRQEYINAANEEF